MKLEVHDVASVSLGVETGESSWHFSLTVVFVHLWQVVSIFGQVARRVPPPDWEVLLKRSAEVGAVGSWLHHDLVERFVRSLPVSSLDGHEAGESQGSWQTKNHILGLGTENRSHKWIGDCPTESEVENALGAELLQLGAVKLLHFDDLPLR